MSAEARSRLRTILPPNPWVAVIVGLWAAAIACAPGLETKLLLLAPAPAVLISWWMLLEPERWLHLLFFSLLLLPPFLVTSGGASIHAAPIVAVAGILIGVLRASEWSCPRTRLPFSQLTFPILLFFAVLFGTTPLALLYSGPEVAAGSLMRVLLFGVSIYVFLYTLAGPRRRNADSFTSLRLLFGFAILAALFACIDFYFHLPAPAGFGEQFIWLDSGVFRRAQGLFYEASTLGNFSAFFLIMILAAGLRARQDRPCSRLLLAVGFVLFSGSLIFSYSRASAINVVVAICALLYVRRARARTLVLNCAVLGIAAAVILRFALPDFFSHYLTRAAVSFEYFGEAPNRILSGRITTWRTILSLIAARPWDVILGIGYKTLPYSRYSGGGLIADNTYLSLLLETGIAGLSAFLLMNVAILRASLKAARSGLGRASFFGTWIFCFWCGELVQMLSGDLITYWRVLPLYFWVLATAVRESSVLTDKT